MSHWEKIENNNTLNNPSTKTNINQQLTNQLKLNEMFKSNEKLLGIQFGLPVSVIRLYLMILMIIYPYLTGISALKLMRSSDMDPTQNTFVIIYCVIFVSLCIFAFTYNLKALSSILFCVGFLHYTCTQISISVLMLMDDILVLIGIMTTGYVIIAILTSSRIETELYFVFFIITIVPILFNTFSIFISYVFTDLIVVYDFAAAIRIGLFIIKQIESSCSKIS
jgi:hypothetical protein